MYGDKRVFINFTYRQLLICKHIFQNFMRDADRLSFGHQPGRRHSVNKFVSEGQEMTGLASAWWPDGGLYEGYGHGGPGVCLGDGQMAAYMKDTGMAALASAWLLARRRFIWRIRAWRTWRRHGWWPDGGLYEEYRHGGLGVCLVDDQTEAYMKNMDMAGLASVWVMDRRRPIRRIWAWRAWRLTGRWSDGGRRSTVPGWTRRRAAPAYARIPDLIYHRPENLRIHTPDSMDISGTYRPETR